MFIIIFTSSLGLLDPTVFSAFYESALSFFSCLVCMYILIHPVDYAHMSVLLYFCVVDILCGVCMCWCRTESNVSLFESCLICWYVVRVTLGKNPCVTQLFSNLLWMSGLVACIIIKAYYPNKAKKTNQHNWTLFFNISNSDGIQLNTRTT